MNYIDVVTLTWIERSWFMDEFMNNENIKYSNINVKQYINPLVLCYAHGYIKNITYLNSGEKLKKKQDHHSQGLSLRDVTPVMAEHA